MTTIENSISQTASGITSFLPSGEFSSITTSAPGQILQTNSTGTGFVFDSTMKSIASSSLLNEQIFQINLSGQINFPYSADGAATTYSASRQLTEFVYTTKQDNSRIYMFIGGQASLPQNVIQNGFFMLYVNPITNVTLPSIVSLIGCNTDTCQCTTGVGGGCQLSTLYPANTNLNLSLTGISAINAALIQFHNESSQYVRVLEFSSISNSPVAVVVTSSTPIVAAAIPIPLNQTVHVRGVWAGFDQTTFTSVNGGDFFFTAINNAGSVSLTGISPVQNVLYPGIAPFISIFTYPAGQAVNIYAYGVTGNVQTIVINFTTN